MDVSFMLHSLPCSSACKLLGAELTLTNRTHAHVRLRAGRRTHAHAHVPARPPADAHARAPVCARARVSVDVCTRMLCATAAAQIPKHQTAETWSGVKPTEQ